MEHAVSITTDPEQGMIPQFRVIRVLTKVTTLVSCVERVALSVGQPSCSTFSTPREHIQRVGKRRGEHIRIHIRAQDPVRVLRCDDDDAVAVGTGAGDCRGGG